MPARKGSISPITRFVRGLPDGPFYTVSEAARLIGVTVNTLRRSMNVAPLQYGPYATVKFGRQTLAVYRPREVQRAKEAFVAAHNAHPGRIMGMPGRPRLWTSGELAERARRSSRASYCRRRAVALTDAGNLERAEKMQTEADGIARDLRAQNAARLALVTGRSE